MKKFLIVFVAFLMGLTSCFVVGCNEGNSTSQLTFYAPDGAPALAIAKFIKDGEDFGIGEQVNYTVVDSSSIGGVMSQGLGDFIVMPINAASKLYNAKADNPYVMAAVLTHGNLYIMSSDGTNSLQSLKGKVVGVIGMGLVPDLTLRAVLKDNGLLSDVVEGDTPIADKIVFKYFQSAADLMPLLKKGELTVGLLPEPAATKLTKVANNRTWTVIDLQELYDVQLKAYPQAVLMVRKSVYNQYKDKIEQMNDLFRVNVQWVKDNPVQAVEAVSGALKEGVTPNLDGTNISSSVVDNCKIYFEDSATAKEQVKNYLNKLISINPQSAKAVGEDFFA